MCNKGGVVSYRHNSVGNLFTSLLDRVCNNVQIEPHLIPLGNKVLPFRSSNTSNEARLDMKANGFWRFGHTAFFYVRNTHVNAQTYRHRHKRHFNSMRMKRFLAQVNREDIGFQVVEADIL